MAKKKKYTEAQIKYAFRQLIIFGALAVVLFAIDIISKWIVQNNCTPGAQYQVIPNFFYITLSYNTGAAFSMGANWGVAGRVLGIIISVVLSAAIIWYWIKHNKEFNNFERAIASLMSAGAVGNLIDRAFYFEGVVGFNGVIDFFQFYLGGGPNSGVTNMFNPFATFNFADACLVVGVILFLVDMIFQMVKQGKDNELRNDPRLAKKPAATKPAPKPVTPVTVDDNDEDDEEEEGETWTPEQAAKMKGKEEDKEEE